MELRGKNVLVVGFERTGEALCRFLLDRGARVRVTEKKPADALGEKMRDFAGRPINTVFWGIKNYVEAFFRTNEPLLKGLALGGLGAVLAFGVNSFFHNLFDSTLMIWLLAGLSLAISKVVLAKSPRRRRPRTYT